jgi:hypothetical protein
MSQLGEFLSGMVQRSHQGTQDRAALNTLAQFSDDQDSDATEKLAQRGKQASALRNVIKSYSDNPDLGHAINSLGVDELEGIMHGMALNQAQQEIQSKVAEAQAQTAWLNQRTAESAGEGNALSEFARNLLPQLSSGGAPAAPTLSLPNTDLSAFVTGAPAGGAPAPASPTPDINGAVLNAMANMGSTNPKMAGVMLNKLLPSIMGTAAGKAGFFKAGDAPQTFDNWERIPTGPNTSQVVYKDPSGGGLKPMTDPDGNLQGYSITDARGHTTFHPSKGSAKLKQATDGEGNVIEGFFMDDSGKLHDTRDALDKDGYDVTANTDGTPRIQLKVKGGTAPEYKTKDDVVKDFKAGKITRDKAAKILNEQFKVPLK